MQYFARHGLVSQPWEHQVLYDVFESHGEEYNPDQSSDERRRYLERLAKRVFRRLDVATSDGTAAEHAEGLWEVLGPASLVVYPEVHEVLERLSQAAIPVAIISNWQCGLEHFCRDLGLGEGIAHVLASAEVDSIKPDRGIFDEACRRLGVPSERVLHVGDTLRDDYEGGRSAGLKVVLVQRGEAGHPRGVPTMPDLRGILDLLDLS